MTMRCKVAVVRDPKRARDVSLMNGKDIRTWIVHTTKKNISLC